MLSIGLIQTGELIARKSFYDSYQLLILFLGVAFIGMARLSHSKTISSAFGTLLNFKTEVAFNDSIKIHPTGSFFLILNFVFSVALLLFLASETVFQNKLAHYLFSFGLATLILFIYLIGIYLVGFIASYSSKLPIGQLHNLNFIHICGITALILDLPWLLNSQWNMQFSIFAIILFSLLYVIRLVKITSFAFQENISWYYIILYLCTLEFFPIYMFIHVFLKFSEI
jgi:hypothetical protein